MQYILFALYLILFSWLVTRVRFFRRSELSSAQLFLLFLAKVVAGIFYGWIGLNYPGTSQAADTWFLHWESIKEYQLLLENPGNFFSGLFHSSYPGGFGNFLSVNNSWWNDVKANVFIKMLAIFNLVSFGNYYVNVILYSFVTLFGSVALYRVMRDVFPLQRIPVLLGCFLLPSFIYWGSGINKDGMIFLALALVVYHIYFAIRYERTPFYRYIVIILSLLFLLLLRNFMVLTLAPALLAWYLSYKLKYRPLLVFAASYLLFALIFFTAKYIHPSLDFPAATLARQESFINLQGGRSEVAVQKLEPGVIGFIKLMPQAFYLSVLRPTFSDVRHLLTLAACVELYFYILLFVTFLFARLKTIRPDQRFMLFCLFFSFSVLMMVGYTVNNLGAIARYRAIVLPFLVVPMLAMINWQKLGKTALNT